MIDNYSETESEIIGLTYEWIEAVQKRDAAALDRTLDDEFIIAGWRPEGFVGDKKVYIEDCLTPVALDGPRFSYERWKFRVRDNLVVATVFLVATRW